MRSISLKLLLGFIIVSLIGTAIFFGVARWNSNREIQDFLSDQDQAEIVERAAEYYLENGSWEGFGKDWVSPPPATVPGGNKPGPFSPFTLVDLNQQVVFGRGGRQDGQRKGEIIPDEELENALEITSDGELIGWLLFTPIDWREAKPDHEIFKSMDSLLIYSAVGSVVVAVVLGVILSRTLSRPFRSFLPPPSKPPPETFPTR